MLNTPQASTEFGVTLTAPAAGSENTKGSWVALDTATAFEGFMLHVFWRNSFASNTLTATLCDIGIDAAGGTAYTVLVPNIQVGYSAPTSGQFGNGFLIPVYIPAGSTIAGRIQSAEADQTVELGIALEGGVPSDNPFPGHGLVVDYGTNTSDSGGVVQINGATDVKAAWKEIVSATTHPHAGITFTAQPNDTGINSLEWFVDIGIGGAGVEVVIIPDIYFRSKNNETFGAATPSGFLVAPGIPEGSRIAARMQASNANNQVDYDIIVYGWG